MLWVILWLLYAIPCFLLVYTGGAHWNFRIETIDTDEGWWKFHKDFYQKGFKLFLHDYLGVYCPWSWETAKKYRLADMRIYLKEGRDHLVLGHITAADCDDPAKQEAIARNAYVTRLSCWRDGVIGFLFSPIKGTFILFGLIVTGLVELIS